MARVVLIGMPGSGKTTVGKALARLLGLQFADSDRELVAHTGVSVVTIFEIEGEDGFRRREAAIVAELLERDDIVLATGGGAILSADTRERMRNHALVIYLRASVDALVERTQKDTSRPLLAQGSRHARLTELLEAREPLYRETAHLIFETGRQSPSRMASHICETIKPRLLLPKAPSDE